MTPSKHKLLPVIRVLALHVLLIPASRAEEANPAEAAAAAISNTARNVALVQAQIRKASYENAIAALEASSNAYGPELSEAYMGLGSALRTLELHEEAVLAFGTALQSLRISYGLQDLRQLPVLEQLLATNLTLENWEEVDSLHHLIYHITSKSLEAGDELRFQSMLQLGRWRIRAGKEELLPEFSASARNTADIYRSEIRMLEGVANVNSENLHLATLYLDLAALEFTQATTKYEQPITDFGTSGPRSYTSVRCLPVQLRSGGIAQVCETVEVPNMNYYFAPSDKKNQEIGQHLSGMKSAVMDAYNVLQVDSGPADERGALLSEVQRLTNEYNEFVDSASSSR